jgi:micrococcal nuclease
MAFLGGRMVGARGGAPGPPGARGDRAATQDAVARTRGTARIVRVVDGDTVVLAGLGRSRLIGIDTPEVWGRVDCYGPEASTFAKRTLAGRTVRYEVGAEPRDRYGRPLVYIWLDDGRFVNGILVERGYARTLTIPPNDDRAGQLARLSERARAARRGLWRACPAPPARHGRRSGMR